MTGKILLFDMDGVLLEPGGYRQSMKASVRRISLALGMAAFDLSSDQIAHFEALTITNEWDTLAICTALMLLEVWRVDPGVQLSNLLPCGNTITDKAPDIDGFLNAFGDFGDLPCQDAFEKIIRDHPELSPGQKSHLREILFDARDIRRSLTMPGYQETVLGSGLFEKNYGMPSQLKIESYLTLYDRPGMSKKKHHSLMDWLSKPGHHAGILTNRPSTVPQGYLSSPEAELGAQRAGLGELHLLGSGMLAWFAITQCRLLEHTFLKPNPVHALALMQMCLGDETQLALKKAYDLWRGQGNREDWARLDGMTVTIFEDAVRGFEAGLAAKALLQGLDVSIEIELIGISRNRIKKQKLRGFTERVYEGIDEVNWEGF